ncbi:MAG: hypothetical protein HND50_17765 [Calditrichaeota bacterium]|nr:hypothetical protein [Calditrichota bacterium]
MIFKDISLRQMKYMLVIMVITSGVLFASNKVQKPSIDKTAKSQDTLSIENRAYFAGRIYSAIKKNFAHWDNIPDFDLDSAFQSYLNKAMTAKSRKEFSMASLKFVADLNNSHSGFWDTDLLKDVGGFHGFSVRYISGQWIIDQSSIDNLHPGSTISAINNVPIELFYQKNKKYISASTERYRRYRLFDYWQRFLFPVKYKITLNSGKQIKINRSKDNTIKSPEKTMKTSGRWIIENNIAYIKIPAWSENRFEKKALLLLSKFKNAHSLVIDVRNNSGGSSPLKLIGALMERKWRWWTESTPLHIAVHSYYAKTDPNYAEFLKPHLKWSSFPEKGDSLFLGKIVILMNEGSHSASEDFIMPFKDNGRAILVGRATAGSTGQPFVQSFGNGMGVAIGTKREYFPDGSSFEGFGIQPDIKVYQPQKV